MASFLSMMGTYCLCCDFDVDVFLPLSGCGIDIIWHIISSAIGGNPLPCFDVDVITLPHAGTCFFGRWSPKALFSSATGGNPLHDCDIDVNTRLVFLTAAAGSPLPGCDVDVITLQLVRTWLWRDGWVVILICRWGELAPDIIVTCCFSSTLCANISCSSSSSCSHFFTWCLFLDIHTDWLCAYIWQPMEAVDMLQ